VKEDEPERESERKSGEGGKERPRLALVEYIRRFLLLSLRRTSPP
jgi:hypothetical protein